MPRFRCPACRGRLAAPAAASGRSGHCPRCDREIRVPVVIKPASHPVFILAAWALAGFFLLMVAMVYHATDFTRRAGGGSPPMEKGREIRQRDGFPFGQPPADRP